MAIQRYVGDKFVGLASDTKPTGVQDGARFYESDTQTEHIVLAAVDLLARQPAISAVTSVVPWEGTPPLKACTVADDGRLLVPLTGERRQDQPRAYRRDGTVYAVRRTYAAQGDLYGPHPVPMLVNPADSVTLD